MSESCPRVLLAEDELAHAEAIRRAFQASRTRAEIQVAGTLREYRAIVEANPPDIALLDLNLPDGRAVEALASPPEAGRFPVLIMTSFGDEQIAVESLKAGALDYIVKSPEAFSTMPRTVERALREWELLRARRQNEARILHLNSVLRGIRNVNQLITQERDPLALIRKACELLVDSRGFHFCCIAICDGGSVRYSADAGVVEEIGAIRNRLSNGELPECMRHALRGAEVVVHQDPTGTCHGWAVSDGHHEKRDAVSVRFASEGKVFGVLLASLPAGMAGDREELDLLREVAGDVGFALGSIQLHAQREEAEESLRESERSYRSLFENTSVGLAHCRMLYDGDRPQDFVYLGVNSAFTALTGLKDVTGKKMSDVIPGVRDSDPRLFEIYGRVARDGSPERFEIYLEALREWFDVSVYSPKRDHFVAVYDVITKRKRAEEENVRVLQELEEGKARTRAIYDHLPNATFVWKRQDTGFVLADFNEAARSVTSGGVAEFVGKPPHELHHAFPHLDEDLASCFEQHAVVRREVKCAMPGAKGPRQLVLTYGFIPSDMVILHTEDVTERRQAAEQLKLGQRLEAVGRLAGGVAHDFNNLLSVIISYAGLAIDALRESDPVRADIAEIQRAGQRAAALTRQLLAFSRKQILEPEVLRINEVVTEIEAMLRRLLGEDIDIEVHLPDDLGNVVADRGQLEQVIMNLAVNSRDAMPQGGRLIIETANVEFDQEYSNQHLSVKPGRFVMLSVTDTGCGMDAESKAHLFEPFFTTKEKGKGTGLGLSTVYGIVKQSGGHIWVYSELGHGTTFKVYLPEVDAPAAEARRRPTSVMAAGSETVLLVEDEDAVRRLAERILRSAGYRVLAAPSGGDALILCEKHGEEIDILLTDVVMPQMSGRELAERLAKLCPRLKVLYMSGYTDNAIVHHGVLDPGTRFIGKPFSAAELTRRVRDVLDGDPT